VSLVAVFLFFGLGAALVGLALALVLASSPKRAAILSLGGVFTIVALVPRRRRVR
jgi:urea transporter